MTSTASPPQHAIELRTLGHLDLRTADGIDVRPALAQGKRMALLTYLAVAKPRGFHRRDTLVGLFWPETDQRHARAALRQALHFLRQSLGRDVVLNRGPEEIGVDFSMLSCDAVQFEESMKLGDTERAVGMYGGPLLRGFFVSEAPEFEKWLSIERDRLALLYADGLRSLAETSESSDEPAVAARWWKRLATHDPYSSEVAVRVILALEAAGDRAGAFTHAQSHIDAVQTELEVEPDNTVLELVDRLREQPTQGVVLAKTEARDTSEALPQTPSISLVPSKGTARLSNSKSKPRTRVRYLLAAAMVLAAAAALMLVPRSGGTPAPAPVVSLAVLPFDNLGSPADEYFVVGLAEDIVCRLAGVQRLSLVGPNDGGLDTPDDVETYLAAGMEADYILRASVERVATADGAPTVRLIPSLTRVADGAQIWTEALNEQESQLFVGQVRVVENIVRALGISPLSTEREWLRATPTSDPVAFHLFLLGNRNLREASNDILAARSAVDLYEQAIARDSSFVRAFAKLAIAHTSMFWWNHDRSQTRLSAARAAADAAIRLRPDMPQCHLALGWYYYWGERDYDRALRHFELARTNWPGVSDVLALVAGIRRRQGDFARSLDNHYEAAAADPSCATCFAGAGFTHLILRDFEAAEREAERALSIAPNFSYARNVMAMARLSNGLDTTGAREALGRPASGSQILRLHSGHWSTLPRAFGGEYDSLIIEMSLSDEVSDSAGYHLAKAEVYSRLESPGLAHAHYDSARTILEHQLEALPEDPRLHSRLGLAFAGLGMQRDAVREGTEATRLRPVSDDAVDGPLAVEMLARIYAVLGDADTAIDRLEMLLSMPSHLSAASIRLDPIWEPLRQHPRYPRLIR